MREDNRKAPDYSLHDATDVLIESVMQWKKQRQMGQATGRVVEQQTRAGWIEDFRNWLEERE